MKGISTKRKLDCSLKELRHCLPFTKRIRRPMRNLSTNIKSIEFTKARNYFLLHCLALSITIKIFIFTKLGTHLRGFLIQETHRTNFDEQDFFGKYTKWNNWSMGNI